MNYTDPNGYFVSIINFENYYTYSYWFETYTEMINSFQGNVIWNHERGIYIVQPEFISERDYIEEAQDEGLFEAFDENENDSLTFDTYEEMMNTFNNHVTWNHESGCYIHHNTEMVLAKSCQLNHTTNEL